jgi:hypothetical protein
VPRKPREASSKSLVSANGSAFSVAAWRATTDLMLPSVLRYGLFGSCCRPPSRRNVAEYFPIDLPHPRALPIKPTDEFGAYARRICASLGLGSSA